MVASSGIMDQQVDDLRERMRLLQQDRRANIDLMEATKLNNAEEVKALRDGNKELRLKLTQLQKNVTSSKHGGENELSALRKEVLSRRTEYDLIKTSSSKQNKNLDKLKDEAKTCELEAKRPSQEDTPLARQIRMLENRLDKAMIKYNEAQSIRSTYEHIVKRLKEERVSFDNQLTALERTLQSKQRDYEELLLLSGDASHARDVAQQELHAARCTYEEKRIRREGEIRERHQVIKVRKQMLEKQQRREAKQKEIIDGQLASDGVDAVGEAAARASMSSAGGPATGAMDAIQEEEESKIDIYENAFRKIKEATGVSDVNEVIQKIIGQESTTENLIALTKQNQERIEILTKHRDELKKNVDDLKYSGSGSPQRRSAVEEKKARLNSRLSQLERCKSKYDRYATVLINMKAGVKHLQDKLVTVRDDLHADDIALTDSSLPDVLWSTGDILVEVLARIREREITGEVEMTLPGYGSDMDDPFDEDALQENRPFNQRIVLPSARDDVFEDESFDDGYADLDEEEISRDRVKKASMSIMQAQQRKKMREARQRSARQLA